MSFMRFSKFNQPPESSKRPQIPSIEFIILMVFVNEFVCSELLFDAMTLNFITKY